MNHLTNDYGKIVIAIGAPGSVARVLCQYPKLIDRVSYLHMHAYSYHTNYDDEIVGAMIDAGIDSKLEAASVVKAVMEKLVPDFPGDKMERISDIFLETKCRISKE